MKQSEDRQVDNSPGTLHYQHSKTVAIYARVSTDKQKVDMQLSELRQFANSPFRLACAGRLC